MGAERADRSKTTIVLADDHAVVRRGLRMLVDAEPVMQVLAEAADVSEAERLTRAHRPRVLVLDLNMPGGSSLEAIPRVRESSPDVAIVVLTMQDDLSEREVEVLRMVALGHTNAEIAEQLYLSARTVETHRAHVQQKLRVNTRAELVRYALDHGLLDQA